jgi:putative oxidoreductase
LSSGGILFAFSVAYVDLAVRAALWATLSKEDPIMSELLYAVGRALIPVIFIVAGIEHFINIQSLTDNIAAANVPLPPQVEQYVPMPKYQALAYLVAAIEIIAGVLVFVGFLTRIAAFALFVFCGLTIYFIHHFWDMEGAAQTMNQIQALKNLALMGGLLLLMAKGAGAFSLDGHDEHAGHATSHHAPAAAHAEHA